MSSSRALAASRRVARRTPTVRWTSLFGPKRQQGRKATGSRPSPARVGTRFFVSTARWSRISTRPGGQVKSSWCSEQRQVTCLGRDRPHQAERKTDMVRAMQLFLGIAVLSLACAAAAQKPIVYPAKGQSPQQQSQDDAQCYAWAKQSTGIDPAVVASSPPPQQTGPAVGGGQRLGGCRTGCRGRCGYRRDRGRRRQGRRGRGGCGHYGRRPAGPPTAGGAE